MSSAVVKGTMDGAKEWRGDGMSCGAEVSKLYEEGMLKVDSESKDSFLLLLSPLNKRKSTNTKKWAFTA